MVSSSVKSKILSKQFKLLPYKGLVVKKNNLVTTIDKWGPNFNIKFSLKILKKPTDWYNLLHLTTGEDCCQKGTRTPAIFLNSDANNVYMLVCIALGEGKKSPRRTDTWYWMDLHRWYNIEMTQKNGNFSLKVNDTLEWQTESVDQALTRVNWYQGDEWYKPAVAWVNSFENMVKFKRLRVKNNGTDLRFVDQFSRKR